MSCTGDRQDAITILRCPLNILGIHQGSPGSVYRPRPRQRGPPDKAIIASVFCESVTESLSRYLALVPTHHFLRFLSKTLSVFQNHTAPSQIPPTSQLNGSLLL